MVRVIFASRILADIAKYTKWRNIITNVLLKDDSFNDLDHDNPIVKAKLTIRLRRPMLKKRALQLMLLPTCKAEIDIGNKNKEAQTSSAQLAQIDLPSYLLIKLVKLKEYKRK